MSTPPINVTVEVSEAIDVHIQQVAQARAREVVIFALWQQRKLTDREAARELDLADDVFLDRCLDFLDQLAAEGISFSAPKRHPILDIRVETRDLSYYNFLTASRQRDNKPKKELACSTEL